MANGAKFEIQFTGDSKPVTATLEEVQESFEDFQKKVKKTTDGAGDAIENIPKRTKKVVKDVQVIVQPIIEKMEEVHTSVTAAVASFDELGAGKAAMDRLTKSIDETAEAAKKSIRFYGEMGARLPLSDIKAYNAAANELVRDLNNVKINNVLGQLDQSRSVNNLASSLKNVKPGANQAALAMTDLGRVAQDLPFGFIAIQNNLAPLAESFGRVKEATGSTRAAFGALLGAIGGTGGIGLGIGLATLAWQAYNKFTKDADVATKKVDETLKSAIGTVAQEASRVAVLVDAIKSETLSRHQKLQALEELKKLNPNYFGQLKDEKGLVDNLTSAYNAYTQNLVKAAQSKAFEGKLQKLFEKKIDVELSIDPDSPQNIIQIGKSTGESLADEARKAYNIKPDASTFNATDTAWSQFGASMGKEFKKGVITATPFFDKKIVNKELNDINSQIDFFTKKINDLGQTKFDPFNPKKDAKEKTGKTLTEIFADANEKAGAGWQKLIEFSEKGADKYFDDLAKQISAADKRQQVIDAFNGTNDAIKKGIVGFGAQGALDPFGGLALAQGSQIDQLTAKIKALGQTPVDTSFLSDLGAQVLLLSKQYEGLNSQFLFSGELVAGVLQPAFSQLFDGLTSGTQSAAAVLRNFFLGIIKQIAATVAQAAALAAILSAFGLSFGGVKGFSGLFKGFLGGGGGFGALGSAAGGVPVQVVGQLRGSDIFLSGQRGGQQFGRIGNY